jgi:hypothetical protein
MPSSFFLVSISFSSQRGSRLILLGALNGVPLAVAGKGRHDLLYRVVKVEARTLRRGDNVVRVLSDTSHHGIEVVLPGPALVVRVAAGAAAAADEGRRERAK